MFLFVKSKKLNTFLINFGNIDIKFIFFFINFNETLKPCQWYRVFVKLVDRSSGLDPGL